jgi:predicted MFS family arabinose efflux permease
MATANIESTRKEWESYWPLVAVSCIGLSYQSLMTYGFGLFIEPITAEFGWSRAEISAGLSLAAIIAIPMSPLLGVALDRWGVRALALPGIILTAISIIGFSFANGSVKQWIALWLFYSVIGVGINSAVWTTAVSGVFNKARGMALGLALSGIAVAQIVTPPLAQWLIADFGWRNAFIGLALGWGIPVFALCYFYLFDVRDLQKKRMLGVGADAALLSIPGLTINEALRSLAVLRIAVSTLIIMVLTIGMIVHLVPVLSSMNIDRQTSAYLASLAGFAAIAGKLISGYLLDKMDAGLISSLTVGSAGVAFALLFLFGNILPVVVVAILILGYSSGSKVQICAYQTSRYVGMKNFGKVYGVMASLIAVGAGLGPYLAGLAYDLGGSYDSYLITGIPLSLLAGALLYRLGPHPEWPLK